MSVLDTVVKGMTENVKKVSDRATVTEIQNDLHAGICANNQKGA